MVDVASIAGRAIQSAITPPTGGPGAASPEAVAALDNALAGQAGNNAAVGSPQSATPPVEQSASFDAAGPAPPAGAPDATQPVATQSGSLGDKILNGLGQLSQNGRDALQQVQSTLDPSRAADMSAADLMRAQFALTQVSLQQDLTAKVVGKATQTVDTFLKNQ